jgi:hypothetical protein
VDAGTPLWVWLLRGTPASFGRGVVARRTAETAAAPPPRAAGVRRAAA